MSILTLCAQSAKSDSLFAIGVNLYKTGKYQEAIPFFAKSDSIDKATLDTTSNRRDYSAMWLASCFYNLGETNLAMKIDSIYYKFSPIDRRLTLKSDSIFSASYSSGEIIISSLEKCSEIEKEKLGKTNYWYGNTLCELLVAHYSKGNLKESYEVIQKLSPVVMANEEWAQKHITTILYICNMLMYDDPSTKATLPEITYNLAKITYNTPYNSDNDGFYGDALRKYLGVLIEKKQLERAIEECETTRKLFKDPRQVYNKNRIILLNALATLYAKGSLDSSGPKNPLLSYDFTVQRWPIYEEVENVIEHTMGKYSLEWSELQLKKSHFFIWDYNHLDIGNTKKYLFEAFDCYGKRKRTGNECKDYLSLLSRQSGLFASLEEDEKFLDYAYSILGKDTTVCHYYGNIWNDIASKLSSSQPEKAISIYQKLYKESVLNHDTNGMISDLMDKAFAEYSGEHYKEAVNSYVELNDLVEHHLVNKDNYSPSDHAEILNHLALCYYGLGDSTLYNKYNALAIEKKKIAIKTNNNEYNTYSLLSKIEDLIRIGEWTENMYIGISSSLHKIPESIKFYKMAVDTLLQFQDDPQFISLLDEKLGMIYNRIAMRYIYLNDYDNACNYLNKVTTLCPDTLGYNYINAMQWYGHLYNMVSVEPELSLEYYYRNVKLMEEKYRVLSNKILPQEKTVGIEQLIRNWQKCSSRYEELGYYEEALNCLDRALELIKGTNSEYYDQELRFRHQKEIELFSSIGIRWNSNGYYSRWSQNDMGDDDRCRRAAHEMERTYLERKQPTAEDYLLMSNIYNNYIGDSLSANKYCIKAIDAIKKESPSDYKYSDVYITSQRAINKRNGKQEQLKYEIELLELLRPKSNMKEQYVLTLKEIASLYHELCNIDSSLYYYNKYIQSAKDLGGLIEEDAISQFVKTMETESIYKEIVPYYEQYISYTKKKLLKDFKYQTSGERESLWHEYEFCPYSCGEMLNYSYNATIPTNVLYDNLLFRKGLLLNSSISSVNLIRSTGDSLLLRKYDRMIRLKKSLNSNDKVIKNSGRTFTREQAQKLVSRFEEEIMERAAMLGDYTSSLTCTWVDVQSALKTNETAVEFTLFPTQNKKQMYGALILKSEGAPIFLPLFDADSIKVYNKKQYNSTDLYRLLWKPIMQNVGKTGSIYFSPDGALHNIAIEYVPWEEAEILKPKLTRVSSTRVLTFKHTEHIDNKAVVYGGIKYDTNTDVLIADSRKYSSNSRSIDESDPSITDSLNLRSGVAYLPATKVEAENIDNALKKKKISTTLFSDSLATEGAFKDLSGRKTNLLHIATHGFYWTEKESKFMSNLKFLHSDDNHKKQIEDKALSRSGLILAGANNALKRKPIPEGVDDGILTAKEISQLDLRGLELVVLSACQTGLGEITGDGVFGLQRGFKKAGANTLMMSLWKVDDNATQMLMTRFYENLFLRKNPKTGNAFTKSEALKEAQSYIREYEKEVVVDESAPAGTEIIKEIQQNRVQTKGEKVKIKPYQDPKYWAAFILLDAID